MTFSQRLIFITLKGITHLICRVDDAQLVNIPTHGPLIIYSNHVNILEIPLTYVHLQPRVVHGMVLASRWENPVLRWLLNETKNIPLHRNEADITAIHKGLEILKNDGIIAIAPEGTRSHDGCLQAAHAGVVLLALHSHAQLIPMAFYGAENYKKNLSRLKRTDFHFVAGRPFILDNHGEKVTRLVREKMIEEMMYQMASLLPEQYRGSYGDISAASTKYIQWQVNN